jgi:hypothetical protein
VPQLAAFGVLALVHFFDLASFVLMVYRHGLTAEANPIVVQIARDAGLPGLTVAKIVTVGFAAIILVLLAPRNRRLAMGLLMFGIAAGLIGTVSNLATL